MYQFRRLATKNSKILEKLYHFFSFTTFPLLSKVKSNGVLEHTVIFVEKQVKSLLFDCQMCGECILLKTGMTCPMNCPKQMRNGPCGGVRENSNCEVKEDMRCVWVEAWEGAARMQNSTIIQTINFAVNAEKKGSSSWLTLARQGQEDKNAT